MEIKMNEPKKLFLFIPSDLKLKSKLYGVIKKSSLTDIRIYIIPGYENKCPASPIGYCGSQDYQKNNAPNYVHINYTNNKIEITSLKYNDKDILCSDVRLFCFKYDHRLFENSELFEQSLDTDEKFQTLSQLIRESSEMMFRRHVIYEVISQIFNPIVNILHFMLLNCILCFDICQPMIKYSSVGTHLYTWLQRLHLVFDTLKCTGRMSLKTWNLSLAIVVDILFGLILVYYTSELHEATNTLFIQIVDTIVSNLRELLEWLMGSPAGLKLNKSFNELLGKFFLYHITLWWTFLRVGLPLVKILYLLQWLGPFGFTFVTAVLADFIALGTFHVYCIYVYASRFYRFQIMGLSALWRLFLGRKYNPLRDRVDSCQYSHRQLFVGTLAFTILLFLLPTTTLYYAVFATLRLCLIAADSVLSKLRSMVQNLPLFIVYLWLTNAPAISDRINFETDTINNDSKNILLFFVTLKCHNVKQIIGKCSVNKNEKTGKIGSIVPKIFAGHLL